MNGLLLILALILEPMSPAWAQDAAIGPRGWHASRQRAFWSEPGRNDRAEDLADVVELKSLAAIEAVNLRTAQLDEQPWSDSYWPIYAGALAQRYADPAFPNSGDWKANADYLLSDARASSVEALSPAEKYDLLVGDAGQTLTRAMIEEGRRYHESYGKVEAWMGLCHGWAPAAYMLARPTRKIELLAADGRTRIPFYPSDIKGLATLLWSNAQTETRFVGGRCNDKSPVEEPAGRPRDEQCLDNNPATWHLVLVNQIGVARRSFVLDATYDYEVWNQPVLSYSYRYFNPLTGQPAATLKDATVALSSFPNDRFRAFRSRRAASVVGIDLEFTYVSETPPSHDEKDHPGFDAIRTVKYRYDLELDAQGAIIGGEWHEGPRPDFLWTPPPGARALSVGDRALDRAGDRSGWDGSRALPEGWRTAARRASLQSQPLARIVETMIALSRLEPAN